TFKPVSLFSASQISLKTLPNGVRGIVKSAPGSDLVNVQVWVKAGSRVETDKENGSSHLIELLALRGSKNYPAPSGGEDDGGALGALRGLGGDGGSLTSRDSTFFSATVAAPYAAQAVKILADATLRPDMAAASVEEVRLQASDDLARRLFDPITSASDLAYAAAFSKHPYRRPSIGSDTSIGSITPKSLKAFYDKHYVGANISVVIVGQIAANDAQKLIADNFGTASAKKPVPQKFAAETALRTDVVARRRPVTREVIDLAWRSPAVESAADCVALDVLLSLWREGLDANMRRILMRDGEAGPLTPLVASYDVDYLTQRDAGLFIISLVDPFDREGAVSAVLEEVKRVGEKGVTNEELARAKGQLREQ
ncbi:MAG: insulinase family protein, partial [Rhizobiaceae bacterium]